jgi:nucleoside-diphosphate-sugar epimerase
MVNDACEGVNAVIHLAALLPPRSETSIDNTFLVNVEGTRNILKSIQKDVLLIFSSSIAVYGITANDNYSITESHPLNAHDNYSTSKIEAEKLVKESSNPYTILRVAPISVADLVELPEVIPYRGDQRVEFVYVEDVATAAVNSINSSNDREILNISGGASWQMKGEEYIERFYSALGVEVEPTFSEDYTAIDWYNSDKGRHLGYQRTSFNMLEKKLRKLGEELGLR